MVGTYFEENDLILDEKHSIQLTSDPMGAENPGFIINMILNNEYDELPLEQEENLRLLEEDLGRTVYPNLNFRIEICDENFVPLNKKK